MIPCAYCDLTLSAVRVLASDLEIPDPVCCETSDTDGCGTGFFPDDGGPE
jgi:hypothetical protein